MSKNKFIKALKIIAVLGPLVFNLLVSVIGFIGAVNVLNFEPEIVTDTTDYNEYNDYLNAITFNFIDTTIETCLGPYIGIVAFNQNGTIPFLFPIANFITNLVLGDSFMGVISAFNALAYCLVGFICMFLYYLLIEVIFFVPEVFILFIRWSKNLIYSFTQKGGFDH